MTGSKALGAALAAWLVLSQTPARAQEPELAWDAVAGEQTVKILTRNEDGTWRDTTVWVVVVDGQGYVRTGNTRWFRNIERDPDVTLRVGDAEYPLRAEMVEDEALRERLTAALQEKYGGMDRVRGWFMRGRPNLMRLAPRAAG